MLRPLRKDRKNCYSCLDIETGKKGGVLDIGVYDGESVRFFTSWDMFLAFLIDNREDKRYRKFIAHYGGGFDYVSLVEHLTKRTKIKYEVIMSQSKIVLLYVFLGEDRFEFVDSSNVFINTSLAKLCEIFDVPTKKLSGVDRREIEDAKREDPDRYYEYLGKDVISLYQVCKSFERYLEIDFFPVTLASLSLYLYRRRFQKHILFSPRKPVDEFISKAYAGGRVEVFWAGKHDDIGLYDVNSLYPAVMRNAEFPVGTPVRATKFHDDRIGVYHVRFRQSDRKIPPVLWSKDEINGLEFVYEGEGHFFDPEIRLALARGVEIEVLKGYVWLRTAPLFREFVDHFYKLRMDNRGNALDYIAKILMNSLYGKFGQKENKYTLCRLNYKELTDALLEEGTSVKNYDPERGLYEVSRPRRISHRVVNIAAQVTSMGRTALNTAILENAERIVYCDTDSIHIKGELDPKFISTALGAWKLEQRGEGIYTGRKQYIISGKIRFKGMKVVDKLTSDVPILTGEDIEFRSNGGVVGRTFAYFPKLKSVLKTGKKACRIYRQYKQGKRGIYLTNFSP